MRNIKKTSLLVLAKMLDEYVIVVYDVNSVY